MYNAYSSKYHKLHLLTHKSCKQDLSLKQKKWVEYPWFYLEQETLRKLYCKDKFVHSILLKGLS